MWTCMLFLALKIIKIFQKLSFFFVRKIKYKKDIFNVHSKTFDRDIFNASFLGNAAVILNVKL